VKFLTTLPGARDRIYETKLHEALRELFRVIHRRDLLTAEQFQIQLEAAWAKVLRRGTHNVPTTNRCRNRDPLIQARRCECKQVRIPPRGENELKKTPIQVAC